MLDIPNNVKPKEIEASFQKAFDDYWHSSNKIKQKQAWDTMWWNVLICNANIAKNIYKRRGVIVPDEKLEEVIVDSAHYVMKFVAKGVRPSKLSSYNYLRVVRFINDPKGRQVDEKETSFLYDSSGKQLEYGEYYDSYDWMEK